MSNDVARMTGQDVFPRRLFARCGCDLGAARDGERSRQLGYNPHYVHASFLSSAYERQLGSARKTVCMSDCVFPEHDIQHEAPVPINL